jgi:hypothetical protein
MRIETQVPKTYLTKKEKRKKEEEGSLFQTLKQHAQKKNCYGFFIFVIIYIYIYNNQVFKNVITGIGPDYPVKNNRVTNKFASYPEPIGTQLQVPDQIYTSKSSNINLKHDTSMHFEA